MRVLVLHNSYQLHGGEDVAVESEIEALRLGGVDVSACVLSNDLIGSFGAKLKAAAGAARSELGLRVVETAIRRERPTVMHVHNFFPLISPAVHALAHSMGVATVQTLHNFRTVCAGGLLMRDGKLCETCIGHSPYWGAWHGCYRGSRLGSAAVARMIDVHRRAGTWRHDVDRFIVLSAFGRERFARAGFPAGKMVIKSNSVDDPGLGAEGPRAGIVYAGRLSEEKGLRVLVDAARLTQTSIDVIGEGPLAEELQASAPANVSFRGRFSRAEVRRRIASAEAVVVPSVCYEGSPMVVAEAFAAATPVIASRIGSLEDLIEHERTGLHAAPGDARDLAHKLERISADKAAARDLGRQARAKFDADWSPQASLSALLAIYAEATAAFARRDPSPARGGTNGP